jgi:hypothetical protein
MRKASIAFFVVGFLAPCFGQQPDHTHLTVSGCVMNVNGSFRLLTHDRTYMLQGHHNELFSYNGKLLEVTGTVDPSNKSSPQGIPVVLHVTKLKKLADFCH